MQHFLPLVAQGDPASFADAIDGAFAPISAFANSIIFFSVDLYGVTLPLVVIWLFAASIIFTIGFRFANLRGFAHACQLLVRGRPSVRASSGASDGAGDEGGNEAGAGLNPDGGEPPRTSGEISHFEALSSALSGTVGLGNIASVPLAICLGGPGAVFWMVLAGFLGMSSKFAECALSVKYRTARPDGTIIGGPMFYIEAVFRRRGLTFVGKAAGIFFAICTIGASVSLFQVNQSYAQFESVTGITAPIAYGVVISALIAIVILGGIKSIARVTRLLVPGMGLLYLAAGLVIIAVNITAVPGVLGDIVTSAFGFEAAGGGLIGALINGIQRATYSSEAGVGSAAIAHAAVRTDEPMTEGYVALLEPFIDTVVVCSVTALVILSTGVAEPYFYLPKSEIIGIELTSAAFAQTLSWFPYLLLVSVVLFAFSTLVSWAYYGAQAVAYLTGGMRAADIVFKLALCTVLSTGAAVSLGAIIDFTDAMLFGMCIPNIIALYLLMPELRADQKRYEAASL